MYENLNFIFESKEYKINKVTKKIITALLLEYILKKNKQSTREAIMKRIGINCLTFLIVLKNKIFNTYKYTKYETAVRYIYIAQT